MPSDTAGWYRDYFDADFLRIYRNLLPADEAREEAESVVQALGLGAGDRLLDLGCGWGRHSTAFADLGLAVTGLDLSELLLREAAAGARPGAAWVRGDVRDLPFRDAFHAVVSLFSSLGYFLDDGEDLRVLRDVRQALRPGGSLLIETMHRDLVARDFAERDWWEDGNGGYVRVEREFDAVAGVSHETVHWRTSNGRTGAKRHSIRIRSATEWAAILAAAGFVPTAWWGSWDFDPFTTASDRLIVMASAAVGD
jgi:ubiquinone/menaquinone biosynthesis C-methylase UbiE